MKKGVHGGKPQLQSNDTRVNVPLFDLIQNVESGVMVDSVIARSVQKG
jgi:hypothetical protein